MLGMLFVILNCNLSCMRRRDLTCLASGWTNRKIYINQGSYGHGKPGKVMEF